MSEFSVYNSITNKIEPFKTKNNTINWYVCGPTVYDESHLGHARTYLMNDVISRIVEYLGYRVEMLMNITDIDDKIINRSIETYGDATKYNLITKKYTSEFINDMLKLNIKLPRYIEPISSHINDMILLISTMINKDFAYEINGSVYFNSKKVDIKIFRKGQQVVTDEEPTHSDKRRKEDFALWKHVDDKEVGWTSPWGKGRPGWHTECATLIHLHFGNKLQIHIGGIDLCFPHHENEIKQLLSFQEFNYQKSCFIHIGHLHIEGQKMSKSLKNFTTIKNFIKDDDTKPDVLRFMFLIHHYRAQMDFNEDTLKQSERRLHLLKSFLETLRNVIQNSKTNITNYQVSRYYNGNTNLDFDDVQYRIHSYLTQDFQIPNAIIELEKFAKLVYEYLETNTIYAIQFLEEIYNYYINILELFGFKFNQSSGQQEDKLVDYIVKVRDLIRDQAKVTKNKELWKLSDLIRQELATDFKYQIEDKKNIPSIWKKL